MFNVLARNLVLGAFLIGSLAHAELIQRDGLVAVQASDVTTPRRGATMAQVEAQFGAPANKRAAVGQPPITRWDYAQFSVYFEHERVLHAVVNAG